MPESEYRLGKYIERSETPIGRLINEVIDFGRGAIGKPPLWIAVRDLELKEAKTLAVEIPAVAAAAVVPTPTRDFTDMISTALEQSGLNAKDKVQALAMIDNAGVYLHQADTANRLARTATPGSISAEWNELGLTETQAAEIIDKAVAYTQERAVRPDQLAERLAAEMTRGAESAIKDLEPERQAQRMGVGGR